jgi:hypothetical protein
VITSSGRVTMGFTWLKMYLGLWQKPEYTFSLRNISSGSGNWRIDAQSGTIRGSLSNGGEVSMAVDVTDQFSNRNSQQISFVGR